MNTSTQLYPWPNSAEDKGHWFRPVTALINDNTAKYAKPGDLLNVRYPSGTIIQARIFHVQRNLSTQAVRIQCEPTPGHRKLGKPVNGRKVPANYKHARRR